MPKLSILLPTYNGARFLDEQLDSIRAQDDPDFELLAIDDGSTDATRDLLAAHAAREPRMRILPSAGNEGQNRRLVELLGEARGDYVAISDQDDRWATDRNSRLFAALDGRAMAFGRSELIDGEGRPIGRSLLQAINTDFRADHRLRALLAPAFSAHATIVRRDRLSLEAFAHPMPFDWLVALESLFSEGLAYVDDAVIFHRIHGGNQLNNVKIGGGDRKLSGSDVRHMAAYQLPDRVRLWLLFDFLGRSRVIDPALRRTFAGLERGCRSQWFAEYRPLSGRQPSLRAAIVDALAPYAASDEDRAAFAKHVEALTRPIFSRQALAEVARRYRLWRFGAGDERAR